MIVFDDGELVYCQKFVVYFRLFEVKQPNFFVHNTVFFSILNIDAVDEHVVECMVVVNQCGAFCS